MHRSGLTWVLAAGLPRAVAEFASVPPKRRPPVSCPLCGRRVTLKLGRIRRHHAAHAADSVCAATNPETALHVDMKLAITARLVRAAGPGAALSLRLVCSGGRAPCAERRDVPWLAGWDEAVVELRIGIDDLQRRPDIVLRRNGEAIGAIEVLVTNRVSDEKAAALARLGVPWVEVRADAGLPPPDGGAVVTLPATRAGPDVAPDGWRCDDHAWRETLLRAARVVDVYRDRGRRDRLIYRVDEVRTESVPRELALRVDGRDLARVPYDGAADSRRGAWRALRSAFEADVRARSAGPGEFFDSPMRWATGDSAANLVDEALLDVAPGDPFPLATRYPHRWFFSRDGRRWFLPADMQRVDWNRPEVDAFAPHPAWARARQVVRERPIPADALRWEIFAQRPVPVSFGAELPVGHAAAILPIETGDRIRPRRALIILPNAVSDDDVWKIADRLRDDGVEQLWLSHPLDWHAGRRSLPWAASGRDARGRAVVLVDGLGVYRADAFLRAFTRGEPRLRPAAIREQMAERVEALSGGREQGLSRPG